MRAALFSTLAMPLFPKGRRYHAYNDWVKTHHGGRIQKLSLNAGFTCPNRDGTRGTGGCTFCNNRGFTPGYISDINDVNEQIEIGLLVAKRRYPEAKRFLAYFQSYSNTYGDLEHLQQTYAAALSHAEISGIVVGTRPDCLPDEVLDLLEELAKTHIVELEIGIESCSDDVLQRCNRGHDFAETVDAIQRVAQRGLFLTGHLLLGLPGETAESVIEGAQVLGQLPLQAIKFHQLQIVKGTQLANLWRKNPEDVSLLDMTTYLNWMINVLEYLSPDVKIQRIGSEVPKSLRLSEDWGTRIWDLPALLEEALAARDTWQGRLFRQAL